MIILTYKKIQPSPSPLQVGHNIPSVYVDHFADENQEAARARATVVTREGATEVFLSRVYEKYTVEKSIKVEEIK